MPESIKQSLLKVLHSALRAEGLTILQDAQTVIGHLLTPAQAAPLAPAVAAAQAAAPAVSAAPVVAPVTPVVAEAAPVVAPASTVFAPAAFSEAVMD